MAFCCLQAVKNDNMFSETTGGHIIALAHVRLCRFSAYRFQILCCYSDAELFVFFHLSSVFIEVGVGFCPQTAFGRKPVRRRLAKCDAGSSRTGGFFPPRRGFSVLGARHTRRVDRDDFFYGGKIGTIDPFQADEALSVALSERYENTVLP